MNLPLPPVPSSCANKSAISVPLCAGESDRNEIIKDDNYTHYDNFRYPRVRVATHNEKFFPLIDSCIDYIPQTTEVETNTNSGNEKSNMTCKVMLIGK